MPRECDFGDEDDCDIAAAAWSPPQFGVPRLQTVAPVRAPPEVLPLLLPQRLPPMPLPPRPPLLPRRLPRLPLPDYPRREWRGPGSPPAGNDDSDGSSSDDDDSPPPLEPGSDDDSSGDSSVVVSPRTARMRARRAEDSEEEEETSRARDDLAYHEALMRTPLEELAYVTAQTTGRWPRDLTEALRSDRAGTPDLMVLENQLFEPRHRILRRRAAAVPAAAVPVPAAAVPARPWSGLFPRDVAPWSLSRPPGVLSFALDRPLQPTAPSTTSAPNHVGFNLARARSPPGGPAFDLS